MSRWLILGGTRFVGHHIAQAAIEAGHDVTLFHRGQTPAALRGPFREIFGDRDGGLAALDGGGWDTVVDVCGYVPRVVAASVRALAACDHYTFVSTVSVYPERAVNGPAIREDDPLLGWRGPRTEEITELSYGPLKVECEQAVQRGFPGHHTIIRPGYVVGPRDHTHRFSWWVRWLARGGKTLVPDNLEAPIQVVDGRDLARFVVASTERRLVEAFNVVGPERLPAWGEVYSLCSELAGAGTELVPVAESWLTEQGIDDEAIPMWLPRERLGESLLADGSKALAAGLRLRPLRDTVRDILAEAARDDLPADRLTPEWADGLLRDWAAEESAS